MTKFRFAPELLAYRERVLDALVQAGYNQMDHYSGIDLLHDLFGLEVTGIQSKSDALRIRVILQRILPSWPHRYLFLKDAGVDAGWKVVVHRDSQPSAHDQI